MQAHSGKTELHVTHATRARPKRLAAALSLAFGAGLFMHAAEVRAAPPVTNCADSGTGSLRASIAAAASGETIDLSSLACSTITLTSGAIAIAQNGLTIVGPGEHQLTIDGNFNDRPQYAQAGDPSAIPTQWGLLVSSGGIGAFPRNAGRTPWTVHMDTNIERKLQLNNPKAEHPQTLTFNVRSSNMLNHLNVTSVGGVLGSPLFGVPYAADNGRRIEAGVRYSF